MKTLLAIDEFAVLVMASFGLLTMSCSAAVVDSGTDAELEPIASQELALTGLPEDDVIDYLNEASVYRANNPLVTYLARSGDQRYHLVGYTRHNGVWGHWRCSVFHCTDRRGYECLSHDSTVSWIRIDSTQGYRLVGSGGQETQVAAPWPNFYPGDPCRSDKPSPNAGTWDPPFLPYLEFNGEGGDDIIIGPPGPYYSFLSGGSGNDYVENGSTDYRSFAMGGDYNCLTIDNCTAKISSGNDSLFGAGRNYSGTNPLNSKDALFGGDGNDCLRDFRSGAAQLECESGADEYVPPESGGAPPVSCESVVSSCWDPF